MFKIPDEDITSIVKKSFDKAAKEKGLIKETLDEQAQDFDKACGDIRNFPKFDITPNWGRTTQVLVLGHRQNRGARQRQKVCVCDHALHGKSAKNQ